jgi:hypothetical protein
MKSPLVAAALTVALTGCFDDIATEFPDGLEPLEPNEAPESSVPEQSLAIVEGDSDEYLWVHGRGYVFASPGKTWAAAKDSAVMVHVCATDEQQVETGVEDYEYSFKVHYVVEALVTVEWDEVWRFGAVDGPPTDPQLAMVRYQKTYGSDAISLLEGSVQFLATANPDVTEVQFVEHVESFGGTLDDMKASMSYRFQALNAAVGKGDAPRCPE